ncbi:MAG: hydrophobic protein [Candidatus Dormibacteraeota bacterium]|nr:hydrophobic protein [Candidatus Dormibacteraeota bacterium]
MIAALIVLLIILAVLGGGGFALNVLWYILIAALVLWALGFLLRQGEGGGRWYRW